MQEQFKSKTIPEKVQEQIQAFKILISQGYTIIDFEGQFVNKWNFHKQDKFDFDFKESSNYRIPKLKQKK
tara:strand:+ start:414 stop:623 length:210 start_codon:yes stop_codon:yes gene_type:complete